MPYRRFVLPALGVIIVALTVLMWTSLGENLVYYLTPTEALEQRGDFPDGERFRLGGLVLGGTLVEETEGLSFEVGDGAAVVQVVTDSQPPPLFAEDIGVVLEGYWEGDSFRADQLIVKHDEQYRAPDDEGAYETPDA